MKQKIFFFLLLFILIFTTNGFAELTKNDIKEIRTIIREEILQVEKRLDQRIDGLDKRIDGLQGIMLGGFGLLFTSMIGLVGFVLWDRRSALAPAIRKNKELEEREERIERALKEVAMKDATMAEALKRVGLL